MQRCGKSFGLHAGGRVGHLIAAMRRRLAQAVSLCTLFLCDQSIDQHAHELMAALLLAALLPGAGSVQHEWLTHGHEVGVLEMVVGGPDVCNWRKRENPRYVVAVH